MVVAPYPIRRRCTPHQPSAASTANHLSPWTSLLDQYGAAAASSRVVATWLVEGTRVRLTIYLSPPHVPLLPSNITSAVTATHGALLSYSDPVVPLHTSDHHGAEVPAENCALVANSGVLSRLPGKFSSMSCTVHSIMLHWMALLNTSSSCDRAQEKNYRRQAPPPIDIRKVEG
nr:uncharacterized protein LOC109744844 [Aegilops tauschii subsp. strangulata]